MKVAFFALALVASCVLSVEAASRRTLLQSSAEAPSNCPTTVYDVAEANGLTTLLEALEADDLSGSLDDAAGYPLTYTVFAPTNEAFEEGLAALGRTSVQDVLFHGQLDALLQNHFLVSPYTEEELITAGSVPSNFENQTLTFSEDGTITSFGSSANITQADVPACQTIIHVIDGLLVPDFASIYAPAPAPEAASS